MIMEYIEIIYNEELETRGISLPETDGGGSDNSTETK